jgi:SAM-dependent methyltransferase
MSMIAGHDEGSGALARAAVRRFTFLYQDGLTLAATLRGMEAIGLLRPENPGLTIDTMRPGLTPSAFAHLRIGFHTLAQAGWLRSLPGSTPETARLDWSPAGRSALAHLDPYIRLGDYLAHFADSDAESWSSTWSPDLQREFATLTALAGERWTLSPPRGDLRNDLHTVMTAHLDGALAIPALLWMEAQGLLQASGPTVPPGPFGAALIRLLGIIGWVKPDLSWTPHGRESLAYVPHLGLAGSYLPLFARLPACYGGGLDSAAAATADGREWHVQRALNVRASTAAHGRYFADADAIIAAVFDRAPLESQPRFLLDIGCGDGAWLARVAALVARGTLRGQHLAEHPLILIGADPSPTALDRARGTLAAAPVDTLFLPGDVADPDALAASLGRHGLVMTDGLHLHAFVDHDRSLQGPGPHPGATAGTPYLDNHGDAVGDAAVEADLAAHFRRWAPHIGHHGMVVLEGHSVAATVTARHPGALHAIAFEAYHRYSRQYPVERHTFVRALRHAGLRRAATGGRHYPTSRPFVSVSIDHLLPGDGADLLPGFGRDEPRADSWTPDPTTDLTDGGALHALLYEDGDLRYPRRWCAAATATLVTQAMAAIEARIGQLGQGDVLRVCDYGTGTGLAAIELLKACRERGIEERLARRGAALELHLLDIPSSWFAQGHKLLGRCIWVRFHALTDADGRFRPLLEVTGGKRMHVIMASMVFHLIRPQALGRLAADLAALATPDGHLIWNAPDLGPPGPWSVLFHDPNRALRAHWKGLLSGALPALTPVQRTAIDQAEPIDDARADRRILARPHSGQAVADALSRCFDGHIATQLHEIDDAEVLDTLRVPSNQREFLPEIADPDIRWALIEELMRGEILPALRAGPAGGGAGHHVHWTFGAYRVRDGG